MGIFDKFKKEDKFEVWLNDILKNELPNNIKAISFNLYEDTQNKWSIEFVGASSFDEKNDDWACDEVFATRENPYIVIKECDWKSIEEFFINLINDYLKNGKYANKLKQYEAIAIGFVDGDLNIIYKK